MLTRLVVRRGNPPWRPGRSNPLLVGSVYPGGLNRVIRYPSFSVPYPRPDHWKLSGAVCLFATLLPGNSTSLEDKQKWRAPSRSPSSCGHRESAAVYSARSMWWLQRSKETVGIGELLLDVSAVGGWVLLSDTTWWSEHLWPFYILNNPHN